ncbi:hypothetical protein V5O48_010351 [Marasmius crinis-equi]|uniref:Short-chain dehydrogenase n=1 Tax=Marasmius crinis-equi TaxID=585013 RepID=A0ABR3F8K4_9AGAR
MLLTNEQFEKEQLAGAPPPVEGVSLADQVIVITGGNTGLGLEAAKHYAIRGPQKVIIVCRNEKKGQDAVERIKAETGFQNVDLWIADFADFESVKALKPKIDALDRLDILIENAGIASQEYEITKDGWEASLQVNVLGPALHVFLSLPKLLSTGQKHPETTPRVVMVSSDVHYWAKFPAEVINAPKPLEAMSQRENWVSSNRYLESKALDVMFARTLQSHLSNSITICALNPGFCTTELNRTITGPAAEHVVALRKKLGLTAEEGSRQLLFAGIGQRESESKLRGAYVSFSRVSECSDFILSEDGRKLEGSMWRELVDVLGGVDETVKGVVEEYLS